MKKTWKRLSKKRLAERDDRLEKTNSSECRIAKFYTVVSNAAVIFSICQYKKIRGEKQNDNQ